MVLEAALDVAIDAEVQTGGDRRAVGLLERFAGILEATGRPTVAAWSMAAMCASRTGDEERADRLFERGRAAADPDDGPQRDLDLGLIAGRRAEMLWQLDRNEEAVEEGDRAEELSRRGGDEGLAAVSASIAARAHHDAFVAMAEAGDPLASARGDQAIDALVHAIQLLQVAEIDDLAEHLGERLEHLRHDLDDLAT